MTDHALPASLLDQLREMESRLARLERSPRLQSSAIQGGTLTLLADDATPVARIGQFVGPGGTAEVGVTFDGGDVAMSAEHGLYAPGIQVEPRILNTTKTTTSPTFESLWEFAPRGVQSHGVRVDFAVATDVTTTGEVRLQIDAPLGVSYSATHSIPASNPSTYFGFRIDLGLVTNPVALGDNIFARIQARRTAGTGLVHVFEPIPMYFGHPAALGATATGV